MIPLALYPGGIPNAGKVNSSHVCIFFRIAGHGFFFFTLCMLIFYPYLIFLNTALYYFECSEIATRLINISCNL